MDIDSDEETVIERPSGVSLVPAEQPVAELASEDSEVVVLDGADEVQLLESRDVRVQQTELGCRDEVDVVLEGANGKDRKCVIEN